MELTAGTTGYLCRSDRVGYHPFVNSPHEQQLYSFDIYQVEGSTMTAPRLASRFSLRSSLKSSSKRQSHKGVRSWFSSSSKADSGDDLVADADAAAREVDEERQKIKPRTESNTSYVPRVEYGSARGNVKERDAPWISDEQVEQHYATLGWTIASICKDGNCLFRAISDQLYTNELYHQDIRRRLIDFIEKEEKLFQPFVDDGEVDDYCTRMREDGEWGGHLELYAAAKLFNIHIVVHTGPVRRLRVTNDNEGETENQCSPPPYRILHLLYKDDHYSSLHSNEEMKTITPAEYTVIAAENTDSRTRLPTTSHEKSTVKIQDPVNKVVSIQDLMEKSHKSNDPSRKTVMFEEVVEARPPPREEKAFLYEEENLPECGVFLPKQVLFKRGKRRVSGATLFSLVHVPSSNNLKPVVETLSTSETSTSSEASTATISSEGQDIDTEAKSPVQVRSKPKAPTLRAVPVEYPSKATFHKGRTTAAC